MTFLSRICRRFLRALALLPFLAAVLTAAPAPAEPQGPSSAAGAPDPIGEDLGLLGNWLRSRDVPNFVRTYEPTQIGWTKDKDDDGFMDFTFSAMFPLYGDYAQEAADAEYDFRDLKLSGPNLFFSGTLRAGQYILTRPSSPVVGKRFNPQLFLRWWVLDKAGRASSLHKYVDFIFFGHESNGESLTTPLQFEAQRQVYLSLYDHPAPYSEDELRTARLSARDAISRGWDYVGVEGSWSWRQKIMSPGTPESAHEFALNIRRTLRVKLRHFLPQGLAQDHIEEYMPWEGTAASLPRRNYDGITIQYTSYGNSTLDRLPLFNGRFTLTATTGLAQPFQHTTFELDLGAHVNALPFSLWTRIGYNSDLVDYYRYDHSYGFRISIWRY